MKSRAPLIDEPGEVRALSAEDLRLFKPAHQVLPVELQRTLGVKPRGPQKTPIKVATTIRLSPDVMAAFKASGAGWQTRIDGALRDWLRDHNPA